MPGDLTVEVERLADEVVAVRSTMQDENKKRDLRISTNRRLNRWAIAVAIIGVLVGALGVTLAVLGHTEARAWHRDLAAQVDRIEQARTEARLATCNQFNAQQRSQYATEAAQARILVRALTSGQPQTPELAARVDAYLVEHDRQSATAHAERDCSPEGLAKFYRKGAAVSPYPPVPTTSR